jgi:hypothetical protein
MAEMIILQVKDYGPTKTKLTDDVHPLRTVMDMDYIRLIDAARERTEPKRFLVPTRDRHPTDNLTNVTNRTAVVWKGISPVGGSRKTKNRNVDLLR